MYLIEFNLFMLGRLSFKEAQKKFRLCYHSEVKRMGTDQGMGEENERICKSSNSAAVLKKYDFTFGFCCINRKMLPFQKANLRNLDSLDLGFV